VKKIFQIGLTQRIMGFYMMLDVQSFMDIIQQRRMKTETPFLW